MMGLELLHGEQRRVDGGRCHGGEKGGGHGLVDGDPPDVEAIDPTPTHNVFAGTVVPRRGVPATIVRPQPATTMPADGEALQQGRAFSHRAARLMWLGMDVRIDAHLIGLERHPINEAGMMLAQEHRPFRDGHAAAPLFEQAVRIQVALTPRLAVRVGASIHRVGEHMMNRGVARCDPSNVAAGMDLQWEGQSFAAEPEPDASRGPEFGEPIEDGADGASDRFIGMKPYLSVFVAPHESDRQPAAEFAARRLVADAAVQARA